MFKYFLCETKIFILRQYGNDNCVNFDEFYILYEILLLKSDSYTVLEP